MFKKIVEFIKSKKATLTLITIGLLIAYFFVGVFTLGTTLSPSSSFYAERLTEEDYIVVKAELDFTEDQTLKEIWIHTGLMETKLGGKGNIEFRISQSQTGEERLIGQTAIDGAGSRTLQQFNWTRIFTSLSNSPTYKYLTIRFKTDLFVNELIFLDSSGEIITVKGMDADDDKFLGYEMFDEQKRFTKQINYLNTVTESEAYTLSSALSLINTRGYIIDGEANALGTQLIALGVSIFGANTFGLRIMPFLFSFATLVLVYFAAKKITKSEWIAAFLLILLMIGGHFVTVGKSGNVRPIFTFFALLSLLFMYRFYDGSVTKVGVNKTIRNILLSGVFFSLSLAVSPAALFALIGVLILFFAGIFRQRTIYKKLIKNAEDNGEEIRKLQNALNYKEKTGYLLSLAVFILLPVMALTIFYIPSFAALNLHYNQANFFRLMLDDILNYFKYTNAGALAAANKTGIFSALLGLKGAVLFDATDPNGLFKVVAAINPAIAVFALFATISVVYDMIRYLAAKEVKRSDYELFNKTKRPFVLLLAAFCASTLPYFLKKTVTEQDFYLAGIFYAAFIALYVYRISISQKGKKLFSKKGGGIEIYKFLSIIIGGICLISFAMLIPIYFGIPISLSAAKILLVFSSIKAVAGAN